MNRFVSVVVSALLHVMAGPLSLGYSVQGLASHTDNAWQVPLGSITTPSSRRLQDDSGDETVRPSLEQLLPMPAIGRCPLVIPPVPLSNEAQSSLQAALDRIQEGLLSTLDLEPASAEGHNSSTSAHDSLGSIPGVSLRISYRGRPLMDTHVGHAWTKKAVQLYERQVQDAQVGSIPASTAWFSYSNSQLQALHPSDSAGHAPFPPPPTKEGTRVDNTTIFRIGSISKMFTATALFAMVDKGLLGLHDRLADWLGPGWGVLDPWDPVTRGRTPSHAGITFAQLAGHTAGLPRLVGTAFNTTDEALAWLRSFYLLFPPGSEVSYSNIGYALLGQVLAEYVHPEGRRYRGFRPFAEGRAPQRLSTRRDPAMIYARLMNEYVFSPAGMTSSGFIYTPAVMARLSPGYNASGYPVRFWRVGWADPTGGGYSTTADLSRYATALMAAWHGGGTGYVKVDTDGQDGVGYYLPLSPSAAREMLNGGYWYNRDKVSAWGRPWEILTMPSGTDADLSEAGSAAVEGGYAPRSKDGGLPSYAAQITMIPELYLSIAVIWNSQLVPNIPFVAGALGVLVPALETALLGMHEDTVTSPASSLPQALPHRSPMPTLEQYIGTYIAAAVEPLGSEPVDTLYTSAVVTWSGSVNGTGHLSVLLQVHQVDGLTATLGPWELEYMTSIDGSDDDAEARARSSLRAPGGRMDKTQPDSAGPAMSHGGRGTRLAADIFRIVFNRPGLPITAGGPPRGCITLQGAGVYGQPVYFYRSSGGAGAWSASADGHMTNGTHESRVEAQAEVVAMAIPGLQEGEFYERQGCGSEGC